MLRRLLPVVLLALCACAPHREVAAPAPRAGPAFLKLASWNLEFLAEKDGTGCELRNADDYREMRRIADSLDALLSRDTPLQ